MRQLSASYTFCRFFLELHFFFGLAALCCLRASTLAHLPFARPTPPAYHPPAVNVPRHRRSPFTELQAVELSRITNLWLFHESLLGWLSPLHTAWVPLGIPVGCFSHDKKDKRRATLVLTAPTAAPTAVPTSAPTAVPTSAPTAAPTPHPCTDGSHGCDQTEGGICYEDGENSWTCDCKNGYWEESSDPHTVHAHHRGADGDADSRAHGRPHATPVHRRLARL